MEISVAELTELLAIASMRERERCEMLDGVRVLVDYNKEIEKKLKKVEKEKKDGRRT